MLCCAASKHHGNKQTEHCRPLIPRYYCVRRVWGRQNCALLLVNTMETSKQSVVAFGSSKKVMETPYEAKGWLLATNTVLCYY